MTWHLTVISLFILGASVFATSHWDDRAGWLLVIILLLGMIMWDQGRLNPSAFAEHLYKVGFPKP